MARSALLNVMTQAVRKIGRNLARDYGEIENLQVSLKGPGGFVAAAGRKAEKSLVEELARVRPGYGLFSAEVEETGADTSHRWLVDPAMGLVNFLHGLPHFGLSLALERSGQIVAGVIYNPATDDLFTAEKGTGAFLNDRRLRVAARRELADTVIGTLLPDLTQGDHRRHQAELRQVSANVSGVRAFGAPALDVAYVAAGRLDGAFMTGLQPWQIAAAVLMVKEAGGFVTDYAGRDKAVESGEVVCGNEDVRARLAELLAKAA